MRSLLNLPVELEPDVVNLITDCFTGGALVAIEPAVRSELENRGFLQLEHLSKIGPAIRDSLERRLSPPNQALLEALIWRCCGKLGKTHNHYNTLIEFFNKAAQQCEERQAHAREPLSPLAPRRVSREQAAVELYNHLREKGQTYPSLNDACGGYFGLSTPPALRLTRADLISNELIISCIRCSKSYSCWFSSGRNFDKLVRHLLKHDNVVPPLAAARGNKRPAPSPTSAASPQPQQRRLQLTIEQFRQRFAPPPPPPAAAAATAASPSAEETPNETPNSSCL